MLSTGAEKCVTFEPKVRYFAMSLTVISSSPKGGSVKRVPGAPG
jgi:hypothetical protein